MKVSFNLRGILALALCLFASSALAQVTPGTSPLSGPKGGTNNAFMQFSGPATSLKTFVLPNVNSTISVLGLPQVFSAIQTVDLGTGTEPAAGTGTGFNIYGADGVVARSEITAFTNGFSGTSAIFDGRTSLGTRAAPLTVTTGTLLGSFEGKGYDGSVWTGTGAAFHPYAEGTFSPTSHPGEACLATTASGATATTDWWCVHNDGGATLGSPTGGDKGAGTINAPAIYINGVALSAAANLTVGTSVVTGGPGILYNTTSGGTLTALAAVNSSVVSFTSGGTLQASTTLPSGLAATNMALTTPSIGAATGTSLALTSASANVLVAGPNGATNPAFNVDASTAASVTGINIKSAASGVGVALSAISNATNEALSINAKGTSIVSIGGVSTGGVALAAAGGGVAINGASIGGNALAVIGSSSLAAATFSGNVTHSAQLIATGTSAPASAAGNTVVMGTIAAPTLANNGQAYLYNTAVNGAVVQGQGSTYDSSLADNAGAIAIGVSTGTQNVVFGGKINGASISTSGTIAGSVCRTSGGDFIFASAANCEGAGAATTVTATNTTGATTVTGGNPGYALTQGAASNFLANNQLFSAAGGMINKFRNGGMDVWQRGTTGLATASSLAKPCLATADGWCVVQTGALGSCSQDVGNGGPLFSLKCIGQTSNTDTTFSERIESYMAAPLAGQTVTVQFQYKQSTGGSITPKISTGYASSSDNFTTVTSDLAATSLTACAANTWCTESYTLTVSANAGQGYQVTLDCNTALTAAQACWIDAADIRVTPNVATGVNSAPPSPELRPVAPELRTCQRYSYRRHATSVLDNLASLHAFNATSAYGPVFGWPVTMRVSPTINVSNISNLSIDNATGTGSAVSAVTWTPNQYGLQTSSIQGATLIAGNVTILFFNNASGWIEAVGEL
jgi:hypothetical protein